MNPFPASRRTTLLCLLLAAVTLAVYWPVLHHQFINYDDPKYVTENPHVVSGLTWANVRWAFQSGYASNWHPLTWLSHILDVQLFGLDPGWHHFTNLLFHTANTLLLFLLLQRLTGAPGRSALVAALFAIHPLHVESVAWVAERKDVLSGFFFLLTLWAYVRYVEGRGEKAESRKQKAEIGVTDHASRITDHASRITDHASRITDHAPSEPDSMFDVRSSMFNVPGSMFNVRPFSPRLWYGIALGMFALGLMSKPMLVTLPFVLLLLDFWPLGRLKLPWFEVQGSMFKVQCSASSPALQPSITPPLRLIQEKLPFLALSLASCIVTFLVQAKGAAMAPAEAFPLEDRLSNALVSLLRYLGKTIWPVDLAPFYPLPAMQHPGDDQWPAGLVLAAAFVLAALSVLAVRAARRQPWLLMGWLWFLGMLVPVIGLIQVGSQAMADRYTYLPLIGLFIAVVWGAAAAGTAIRGQKTEDGGRRTEDGGQRTVSRVTHHASRITPHASRFTPPASRLPPPASAVPSSMFDVQRSMFNVHSPATLALAATGLLALAACVVLTRQQVNYWRDDFALFDHTLAVTTGNNVTANYVLGVAFSKQGKYDLAISHFRAALQVAPAVTDAHYNLGWCLMSSGKLAEAVEEYQAVLQLNPGHLLARNNLAVTLLALHRPEEALAQYAELARLEPGSPLPLCVMASLLLAQPDYAGAAARFAEAARLRPDYTPALTGLGRALAAQGRFAEAQAQFREVVRLCPTNAEARVNLGNTLTDAGQTNEAAACFAAALRLEPDLAGQKIAEGNALLAKGEAAPAFVCFTVASRLQPANAEARERLGLLYAQQGRLADAVREFQEQLRLQPDAQAWYNLALARVMQGNLEDAAAHYEQAVKLKPGWPTALNDLAWLRATAAQAGVRDSAEAVRLAEAACQLTQSREPRLVGTLAAAYAAAGRFPEAVAAAEKAIALAGAAGDKAVADKNRQLLELYRAGKPYHEEGPDSTTDGHR